MNADEHEYPAPGGGSKSGPMIGDNRPEFNPAAVIFEIREVLARAGIEVNPAPGHLHLASIAAADVLRALGVRPASASERRRTS